MSFFSYIKHNTRQILFVGLLGLCLYSTYLYLIPGQKNWDKSLVLLSEQFLHRKISLPINEYLPIADIADYKYNFYLYFGPFSSILLMPAVLLFGKQTPQYLIGVFSMIVSFITVYQLSKKFKFSRFDSLWLAMFFVFSTVLFSSSVMNISAYQVQSLGVPLVLLALYAYFSGKKSFLAGILIGLAIMTRFTLVLAVVFFLFEFLKKRLTVKQLARLMVPVIVCCILLALYNQRRFHSFFEMGYSYNRIKGAYPLSENLKHGASSVTHMPAHIYSLFIMPPEPLREQKDGFFLKFPYLIANPWGMAIWYTSPLFLLLLFRFKKNKYTLSVAAACGAIIVPLITYYSIGFVQFGYRYALDFLPFLFLLLLPSLGPKLSKTAIALITVGVLFNLIYADSVFGIYPLLNLY